MKKLLASALSIGAFALFPVIGTTGLVQAQSINPTHSDHILFSSRPANASAIGQTQVSNQVDPTASQASFSEFNPNGLTLSPDLQSVMPTNVAAALAQGSKLVGVSIVHQFYAKQGSSMVPTSLGNWEKLNHLSQYNVITSSLISGWANSTTPAANVSGTLGNRKLTSAGAVWRPATSVSPPPGGDGISKTVDNNQLSLMDWIVQNDTFDVNYTFDGQALWASYDTVTGYTDYPSLAWSPSNVTPQTGTLTASAIGVNVNNSSDTTGFSTQLNNITDNQYTISVPQSKYINTVEYGLEQVNWGVTVENSTIVPNNPTGGLLDLYYTQTWTGVTPSFSVGSGGVNLTVSGTSSLNKWVLGPLNWDS